tara:strand:+ start:5188 stop:5361 length:174 start_codon:yes stop_codon:yes gene_type:complete
MTEEEINEIISRLDTIKSAVDDLLGDHLGDAERLIEIESSIDRASAEIAELIGEVKI